ncbi:Transcription intermediary factor 1-alpha [Phytophthora citrophthora]|uniref:Transcription intermediary factor 1-alpha n=1 Tax=Phytophthora citrophthora TaxID=4793 RepID=A0AAD9LQF8_9STRA|nr:Transcription intermediary factor 1-alpha [Phytophthora citrophthora]
MYHGAARDRGDKKRQRLTPPPNEVWMEAIMSKGKAPDGYVPASAASARGVATSSAGAWQDRVRSNDWAATQSSMPPGATQYQQNASASRFQGREVERPISYQGRAPDNSAGYQTRPMDTGYQGRTMDGPVAYQGRTTTTTSAPYQGRTVMTSATYQGRTVGNSTDYQGKTMDVPSRYQGRPMDGAARYQGRQVNPPAGYQERMANGPEGYRGRMADGSVPYQGRLIQGSPAYQGKVMDGPTVSKMYQSRPVPTSSSGKMAEDYKRDRKLPPRVEEMLREQVNLDESVLHDAFAVAMEDLIPEEEANFIAKGLCHLCGVNEKHYVPVVNFCPHADENHSLCREHLRSVYRVRMEALFVGRNGSAPNRRLLRCLICTRGCPCTGCTAEKEQDVQKYKRYLLDTLCRSGQGIMTVVKDDRATVASATTAVSTPTAEGRLTYGSAPNVGGSNSRRFTQYPPTPAAEGRPPIQHEGFTIRGAEAKETYEERRRAQTQLSEYEADERSSRDGYAPSMQTQPKSPSHYAAVPKRAAKDTPAEMPSVVADSATEPGAAVRPASSHVHKGSVESPSSATGINCVESDNPLVKLLRTLNQGDKPATSTSRQSSKGSNNVQGESCPSSNGIAPRSENTQTSGDVDMETPPRTYSGAVDRRRQTGSPYQGQSPTSSNESDDSPRRPSVGTRPVEKYPAQTASESETEEHPAQRDSDDDMSSLDDARTGTVNDTEGAAREEANEVKHQDQLDGSPTLSAKVDTDKVEDDPKPEMTGNHSVLDLAPSVPPSPLHRGPGRPRKHPLPEGYTPKINQKKAGAPIKRGRGRPPKRRKRVIEEDDETEEEAYRAEDDEEDEDDGRDASDSELDTNLDFCEVCQGAGDLVCCDKCPRSFHLKCLHMTENDLPEGDWQCKECRKPSRFDAYSTAVASEQSLLDKCLKIVECLKSHPFSKPFLTPVENVPMYTKVVKQPMDLSKIETKLKKGAYIVDSNTVASGVKELDFTHFANDIRLMWSNCKIFNDDGSGITRAADILSAGFERLYKESIEPPLTLN